VVAGGAIYVHTREGAEEFATRLDAATGKIAWRVKYAAPFEKNQYALQMSKGPHSTPLVAGGRLYTLGATSILSCFDIRDGRVLWRKDFSRQVDTSKLFTGAAMSPVLESGLVMVHIGDDRGGAMTAFDAATGQEKWSLKGDGPGYASPIVIELEGKRQLVTLTDRSIISVDVASGKLLWTLPYKDEWIENIVSPVGYRDTIIFSGVRKPTTAVRVKRTEDRWSADVVWVNNDVSMYMSSPVLDGDYLYGFSAKKKGQFVCLDARTGKTVWATQGREGINASVTAAGDALLILTEAGDLIVARKSTKGFEQLSRYTVAESATYPHPVVLNHQILVKDQNSLTLWQVN
jgi:outer membrane protein assembly factor BamB